VSPDLVSISRDEVLSGATRATWGTWKQQRPFDWGQAEEVEPCSHTIAELHASPFEAILADAILPLSPRTHDPLDELLGDTYTPRDIQIQTPLYPLHSGTLFQVTAHELKLKLKLPN
jgi:hypothetical protein